uniref:RNA helicase n=1 Tax=Tetranychus urticae TaxID=32264 RepID=T1KLU4_TETUR
MKTLPIDSINQIPGYETDYLHKIQEKNFSTPTPVQAHLWPIIFRGRSATCISAPKSGKTLAYLIPALSSTQFANKDPAAIIYGDEGPKVVIVCYGMSKAYEIRDYCLDLLDGAKEPRVLTITIDNEKKVPLKLLNGCEILISTPGPLKRLIADGYIRFDICSLLVFDNADKIFTIQPEFVQSIVLSYFTSYRKRLRVNDDNLNSLLTAPMLVLADSWTKEVANFSKEYMKNSINIFGDLFEAAIAHDLNYKVHFVEAEEERISYLGDLIHGLLCRGTLNRIAIVCSNDAEIDIVIKAMTDLDVEPVALDSSNFNYEIAKLIDLCKNHPRAITIITDDKIKEVPQLNFIDTLVHYSMPVHSDIFRIRFLLMSNLIKNGEQINTHFLLSPVNGNHAHFLCQTLRRISEIPSCLNNLRNLSYRPLCENFLAFGFCPFESTICINRHEFKPCESPNEDLPMDGQVKFEICHIITINQFYIRIVEYRDSRNEDGHWVKYPCLYRSIKNELQAYKQGPFTDDKIPTIGKIYGLAVLGTVHRVRIIENLGQLTVKETNAPLNEDTPYQLQVSFVDFGHQSKALSNQLIELPENLRDYPSLAFKAYLLGIKPVDGDMEWTHNPTETLSRFMSDGKVLKASAWIRLQRKSIFWIDNMQITQNLKVLDVIVTSWNPKSDLIDTGLAVKNDKMFDQVNVNLIELSIKWRNCSLVKSASQAFLPDDLEFVYLSHFQNLDTFYILRQTYYKCLENLEKELAKSQLAPMKSFSNGCLGIGMLKTDTFTSYSRILIKQHFPEENLVQVFFVDWGETSKIPSDCCFTIEEKYIKRLPFQAIKCSLFGVEGSPEPDAIYDLTRTEDDIFKDCWIKKVSGSKENGYSIRLWFHLEKSACETKFHLLSNWLVENGHAKYSDPSEKEQDKILTTVNQKANEDESDASFEEEWKNGEKECLQNLLGAIDNGMRSYLGEHAEKDPVQFDPKKLPRAKRLIMRLKKQKEAERRAQESSSDSEDDNAKAPKEFTPLPKRVIDFSKVLPYDPTTSEESELDSDLEDAYGIEELN